MKINGIKNDVALRRVESDVREMLARKIASAQYHRVKAGAVRNQIVAHLFVIRMINHFDPAFL
jgi:hypothetical protein